MCPIRYLCRTSFSYISSHFTPESATPSPTTVVLPLARRVKPHNCLPERLVIVSVELWLPRRLIHWHRNSTGLATFRPMTAPIAPGKASCPSNNYHPDVALLGAVGRILIVLPATLYSFNMSWWIHWPWEVWRHAHSTKYSGRFLCTLCVTMRLISNMLITAGIVGDIAVY